MKEASVNISIKNRQVEKNARGIGHGGHESLIVQGTGHGAVENRHRVIGSKRLHGAWRERSSQLIVDSSLQKEIKASKHEQSQGRCDGNLNGEVENIRLVFPVCMMIIKESMTDFDYQGIRSTYD